MICILLVHRLLHPWPNRICIKVSWAKWKILQLVRYIHGIQRTIGHLMRPHIKLNRWILAGGICIVLLAVGWIWVMQPLLACMQQWQQIMQPAPNTHRFHIHYRIRHICSVQDNIYYKIPIKSYHHNQLAVLHCHIRLIQRHLHRKHHRHDLNAATRAVQHAIARIVKKPNDLGRPACIYVNGISIAVTFQDVVGSAVKRASFILFS